MTQSSLFGGEPPARPTTPTATKTFVANIDGGARGNPGPAAYGVVIRDGEGKVIKELSQYLGLQTNNFAEYSGLLGALEYAVENKIPALKVRSDSELLVRQMKGVYKVKNPGLQELFTRAKSLTRQLQSFAIEHVLREYNREADRLVNKVLDSRGR
ncbi:MAG TPA: ribonuclease HI family protein [Candidatus Angelobacter sp.]|nr:ribonuclease HI family protein [Candidatus Angelobacter sp.]